MIRVTWKEFSKLFQNNISKNYLLLIGLIITLISAFLQVLIPTSIGKVISLDDINKGNISHLIFLFIITFVLRGVGTWILGFIAVNFIKNIRLKLYEHIIRLPIFEIQKLKTGEFSSVIINDVNMLSSVIYQYLPQFITGVITFSGSLIMLFFINLKLTLMALILIPAIALILIPINIKMEKISTSIQKKTREVSGYITQKISNIKLIKSFLGETQEIEISGKIITDLSRTSLKSIALLAIVGPLISFVLIIIVMLVLFQGTRDVINGVMNLGNLTTFVIYIFQLIQVVGESTSVFTGIANAKGASSKVIEILQIKPEDLDEGVYKKIEDGSIEFHNVTFSYGEETILNNISFLVKPKTLTAIVGPSGAGKSTILSLICKLNMDYTGEILIDGEDIKRISKRSIRDQISHVDQTHSIFSSSVLDNLKYGKNQSISDEDIDLILKNSGLDFIEKMPQKINSILGENGEGLSEGEKQRLSIARSVVSNPQILLLDEITSSLDYQTEHLITSTIKEISQRITVLIIAHRLETILHADKIYVLNNEGKIEAQGTHNELIKSSDTYKNYFKKFL